MFPMPHVARKFAPAPGLRAAPDAVKVPPVGGYMVGWAPIVGSQCFCSQITPQLFCFHCFSCHRILGVAFAVLLCPLITVSDVSELIAVTILSEITGEL